MNAALPSAAAGFDPHAWFARQGWQAFDFQREVWAAIAAGESGLLHADTGAGKTYAIWLGALGHLARPAPSRESSARKALAPPLAVLWITPMRALAADTLRALQRPLQDSGLAWSVGLRTGDTSSSERAAQQRRLPTALITTPESLSLLLARADAQEALGGVAMVVVDEWHELLGSKRGVQVQLALARLRRWNPRLQVWGLSATLGEISAARDALLAGRPGRLVHGDIGKPLQIDTLLPAHPGRFPWAGHLGLSMLPQVVAEIEGSGSTLVFVNTRSQCERWYQALLDARPDWAGALALHHGSLDRQVRDWVETSLAAGRLRAVVCTSSLDLGVDFQPVERVLQIGSAKGIARLIQRAGRSGHAPGRSARVSLVPTHSLEIVEAAAARHAVQARRLEARRPPDKPLDVLVQHLVTVALGGGFRPETLFDEVRSASSYAGLNAAEWEWALGFVRQGGSALTAYPEYRRVEPDAEGVWRVPDKGIARRHRANIGTIVADAHLSVQYLGGARLGSVEEGFLARLIPGDCFLFGGRLLELVRIHEQTAYVRRATGRRAAVPRWNGGKMPLSSELGEAMMRELAQAARGEFDSPELASVQPLLALQAKWSALPTPETLLVEHLDSREGTHFFLYPFAGRRVHLGLASLLAWRLAQRTPRSFSIAVSDYGIELLSATRLSADEFDATLLIEGELLADVLASLNAGELAQRRFREIARIAGLIQQGYPGERRSARQLQASATLFYNVFCNYDPDNLLLVQAREEVLRQELDIAELARCLATLRTRSVQVVSMRRASPFAFPLLVERLRERLTGEKLADRIQRMLAQLEAAAGGSPQEDVVPALDFGLDASQPPQPVSPRRRRARRRA